MQTTPVWFGSLSLSFLPACLFGDCTFPCRSPAPVSALYVICYQRTDLDCAIVCGYFWRGMLLWPRLMGWEKSDSASSIGGVGARPSRFRFGGSDLWFIWCVVASTAFGSSPSLPIK